MSEPIESGFYWAKVGYGCDTEWTVIEVFWEAYEEADGHATCRLMFCIPGDENTYFLEDVEKWGPMLEEPKE